MAVNGDHAKIPGVVQMFECRPKTKTRAIRLRFGRDLPDETMVALLKFDAIITVLDSLDGSRLCRQIVDQPVSSYAIGFTKRTYETKHEAEQK